MPALFCLLTLLPSLASALALGVETPRVAHNPASLTSSRQQQEMSIFTCVCKPTAVQAHGETSAKSLAFAPILVAASLALAPAAAMAAEAAADAAPTAEWKKIAFIAVGALSLLHPLLPNPFLDKK